MARRGAGLFELLATMPWWVSVCVAGVVYVTLAFVVPVIPFSNVFLKSLGQVAPQLAWVAAVLFLLPAAVSAVDSFRRRRTLDRQSGIESIRSLSWKQFEELLAEVFLRQGYSVRHGIYGGADGGIDLVLNRDGNVYLVQCKHWRAFKVGVKVVREMLGLVAAHGAQGAIIVTSGAFTQEARAFASGKPIDLVEGHQLVGMVREMQSRSGVEETGAGIARQPEIVTGQETPRTCPRCGGALRLRVARRGARAGSRFWGCSGYPRCQYTQAYDG